MEDQNVLENILLQIGEFGLYQKKICFFILIMTSITCFGTITYVFQTKTVNHRCRISECESNVTEFNPAWWKYAIPARNGKPTKCSRFQRVNNGTTCYASDFNHNIEEECHNYVYETTEVSILHDFNLQCDENVWKLTIIGTITGVGLFIGLPISGILSDRYGRKTVLIFVMVLAGIIGMIQSFSNSYAVFVVLEVLGSMCRAGAYFTCYILAIELVSPKKRALISMLIGLAYANGGMIEGLIAWSIQSWRNIVRVIYALYIGAIFFHWLVPESIRWLVVKRKFPEAQTILKNIAKGNGRKISEENLEQMEKLISSKENNEISSNEKLISSIRLILRLIVCCMCWICFVFIYYGLTINSVELSKNSYLNFILIYAVEIPGSVVAFVAMDRLGRKLTLICGYLIASVSSFGTIFISEDLLWLKTFLYLLGKFGVSVNIPTMNALTTEIFPTTYRNSLFATCSMFGRIGLMAAPQMPLFATMWEPLPLILFGSASLISALLILFLPETKNITLPSTIEEALNIEKQRLTLP